MREADSLDKFTIEAFRRAVEDMPANVIGQTGDIVMPSFVFRWCEENGVEISPHWIRPKRIEIDEANRLLD